MDRRFGQFVVAVLCTVYLLGTGPVSAGIWTSLTPDNRTKCPETPEARPPNRVNTTDRLSSLRAEMANLSLDAYLIFLTDEHGSSGIAHEARIQYISGYSGSNAWAVVTRDKAALWTDGRYFLQADDQMDCNWILMKDGQTGYPSTTDWLKDEFASSGARVGAFPKYVETSTWLSYTSALSPSNINMTKVDEDLVDKIWTDPSRPPRPNSPLIVHTIEYTGETWQQRIARVRVEIPQGRALVLTVLEQIAWLFNLRGSDRENAYFDAYAIIYSNSARLFLQNFTHLIQVSAGVMSHLNVTDAGSCDKPTSAYCINVSEYSTIAGVVRNESDNFELWIDPTANYAIYDAAGAKRIVSQSPVELMKSIKNPTEREKFTDCIRRDSAAVVEFAAFFENEMKAGNKWTELSAAAKLNEIRAKDSKFKGDSFAAISAFGSNGAIIHYEPTNETDRAVNRTSLYLLDSGGQYLDGTTDITRTYHYGDTIEDEMKLAYTRVLMGQIDLALTVWPAGQYGRDIESHARLPLWEKGWNYNHGSGHGIGYFLGIHEGPASITLGYNPTHRPLYEGMFFSDEPGYYKDGYWGIRLEILVEIVKANTTYQFGGKQYLTFKPLTLVPYEPNLILCDQLTAVHLDWLAKYNKRCLDEVGPLVKANQQAYDWLTTRTTGLCQTPPTTTPSGIDGGPHVVPSRLLTLLVAVVALLVFKS